MQILQFEDDESNAAALEKIMLDNGYSVDQVHDGLSGFEYGKAGNYDVLILDVMLPKMDGFEITRELRRAGFNPPILLLTASDATND